jgi:O-antigen ligase
MGRKSETYHNPLSSRSTVVQNGGFVALAALAFSLSLDRRAGVWFLVASCVPALFCFNGKDWKHPMVLVLLLFYLLHLWGMLFTEHVREGWLDIQQKLAFILFPLLLPLIRLLSSEKKEKLQYFFVAGLFISSFISWMLALGHFSDEAYLRLHGEAPVDAPYTNYFFSSRLSSFVHPGYFATMLIFGIWLLHRQFFSRKKSWQIRLSIFLLQLFLFVTALCMLSKSTILLFPVFLMLGVFTNNGVTSLSLKRLVMLTLSLVLLGVLLFFMPSIRDSFRNAWNVWQHRGVIKPDSAIESSELRILTWRTAWDIFCQHPLTGIGTGDVNPELWESYNRQGYAAPADKHLNAHNQFLQTAVALGIPGLLSLLLLPFMAMRQGIILHRPMWLAMGMMLLWLPMTECWFEQQHGMFFILFWWVYLLADLQDEPLSRKEEGSIVNFTL